MATGQNILILPLLCAVLSYLNLRSYFISLPPSSSLLFGRESIWNLHTISFGATNQTKEGDGNVLFKLRTGCGEGYCFCVWLPVPFFSSFLLLQLNETKLWANVKILLVLESSSRILTYVLVGALGVDPHWKDSQWTGQQERKGERRREQWMRYTAVAFDLGVKKSLFIIIVYLLHD